MNQAMKEMVAEGARLVVFAAVSTIVTYLVNVVFPSLEQTPTVAVLTLALRMADKYIHKNENTELNGILPF